MKILIITNMYPNPHIILSGVAVRQGVKYLRPKGYNFNVIYPIAKPPFPLHLAPRWRKYLRTFPLTWEHDHIPVSFPRFLYSYRLFPNRIWGELMWMSAGGDFINTAQTFQPDVLWCQPGIPHGWATMKLSEQLGIPYVIVIHGSDINDTINVPGAKEKLAEVYAKAARVIAVSERLQREAKMLAPSAKVELIHFGIEPEVMTEAATERARWLQTERSADEITVLSVCTLMQTKGVQYNLEVLHRLKDRYPGLKYRIIGAGSLRPTLEQMVQDLELTDRVTFLGQIDYDQAKLEMARADIFSMPSYKEGIPLVYFESMYLGLPIIGCLGQVDELVQTGENGYLIEPHNNDQLADCWCKLIDDQKLRARIGANAHRTIGEGFTWDVTAAKYDRMFRSVKKN